MSESVEPTAEVISTGPKFRIPGWASVVIVLACLGGAGWLAWQYWNSTASGSRVEVLPRDPADRVSRSGSRWRIQGGLGEVTVTRSGAAGDLTLAFDWARSDYLTPDQVRVLRAVQEIVDRDPAGWSAKLGLSDTAMATLKAVRERRTDGLKLDADDEQKVKTRFAAYEPLEQAAEKARPAGKVADAPPAGGRRGPGGPGGFGGPVQSPPDTPQEAARREAEDELCDAVEDIARRKIPLARKITAERAAAAKAAMTDDQWKKYEQLAPQQGASPRGR